MVLFFEKVIFFVIMMIIIFVIMRNKYGVSGYFCFIFCVIGKEFDKILFILIFIDELFNSNCIIFMNLFGKLSVVIVENMKFYLIML